MGMRKPPSLRRNNGSIQIRVRVGGEDKRIHRLGRWDDPQAIARAQAIRAQIWSDHCNGVLDPTLQRYQALAEGIRGSQAPRAVGLSGAHPFAANGSGVAEGIEWLERLRDLAERKRYGRPLHTYRLVQRYGLPLETRIQVLEFVGWMEAQGFFPSTRKAVLSTLRSIRRGDEALEGIQVPVPSRRVLEEVLRIEEVQAVLEDLRVHEEWFHPCFAVWLGTGLRNSELIGLRWDAVRWSNAELVISRTLRRDGNSNHKRVWAGTKTGQVRAVPLQKPLLELLRDHQQAMEAFGLDTQSGLVFLSPRSYGHLYDGLLENVWKRAQRRVGIVPPRRLYAVRHTVLSHALAMGNSPADVAAAAGHRTEELLRTYAKPTGRLSLPVW